MRTLFIMAAEDNRLLASVRCDEDGVHIEAEAPDLLPLLQKLFARDFDEPVGLPARRIRAPQGSLEAMNAGAMYIATTLGLTTAVQQVTAEATVHQPPRITIADSLAVYQAIAGIVTELLVEQHLRAALKLYESVFLHRRDEAARFGSMSEFKRQHRHLIAEPIQENVTPLFSRIPFSGLRTSPASTTNGARDAVEFQGVAARTLPSGSIAEMARAA